MKWYFALSERSLERPDHDWVSMVRVAVRSALDNTSLDPHFLYDGQENALTRELRGLGVKIIPHRVSFYDRLAQKAPDRPGYVDIAAGAFLRVDIPLIEQQDDYVLYTDCDVVFLKDPEIAHLRPRYFDVAPQSNPEHYLEDMNSGVMVMNLPALRALHPWFVDFIIDNLDKGWAGFDQENYRRFFYGRWGNLDLRLNWKPYWGVDERASILHWHGPKPGWVQKVLVRPDQLDDEVWSELFRVNRQSYAHYARLWADVWERMPPYILAHMDVLVGQGGGGWAIKRGAVSTPARLISWVDGRALAQIICDQPRPDVEALHGQLSAGFNFAIPPEICDGQPHQLYFTDERHHRVSIKYKDRMFDSFGFR